MKYRNIKKKVKSCEQNYSYHSETCYRNIKLCCDTWIGASDHVKEGLFQWTNKENLVFTNWILGEPNNYNGIEHFVTMCHNGQWNDALDLIRYNAICEKDMLVG